MNAIHFRTALAAAAAAVLLCAGSSAFAQAKKAAPKFDAGAAVNLAAREPMLAERITKSYTLISQHVLETRSRRQLDESITEFEHTLKELQAIAPNAEIRDNYDLLAQLWEEYKSITKETANLEKNKQLAEQNEEVVWIATKGANLMNQYAKSTRGDLVATAGDVRILTQRIAKLYLFRSGGIRSQVIDADLKKAELQYRADMEKLLKAPQNTDQIKSELSLAETQYIFLKQSIDRLNRNQTSLTELEFVAKACDNILEVMNRVTKLYEGVAAAG